jgi:hypothetical protein
LDRDEIGKRTAGAASVLAITRKGQHWRTELTPQDQRFGGSAVIEGPGEITTVTALQSLTKRLAAFGYVWVGNKWATRKGSGRIKTR